METIFGHIRRKRWEQLAYGLYQPAPIAFSAQTPEQLRDQLLAWQEVLPGEAAFTHLTAAALNGWWLPHPIRHPHFAAMRNGDPRPQRPGLQVCRHTKSFAYDVIRGLRVTTPAETLLAASRGSRSAGPGDHGRLCTQVETVQHR